MDSLSLEDQRGRQCNVCYHSFARDGEHVPRILTCGHTYCTACLGKLVGKFSHGKICCPTCKTDTTIPGLVNNVQKLAKNFAVLDILEGLEEVLRGSSLATNQMLLCNEHENEPKKVYCLTDSMVICIYCQVYGPHKDHECQLVSQVASNNREILAQMQEDLSTQKKILLPAWRQIQDVSNTVQLTEEKLMREVRQHFDVLRRKLCRREKEVTGHLKSLTSGKVVVLHKQCRRIGELMDRVEQLKMACQSFISGPDYEVVLKMDSLKRDVDSFIAELPSHDLSPCARNNLECDLPQELQRAIAAHGAVIECKDPERLEDPKTTEPSGASIQDQEQSQPVTETSYSGASADEAEVVGVRLQSPEIAAAPSQRNRHSSTRPRQRLQRPDVIIFDSVGDLDEIDPSVCQVRPLCQCHGDGSRGRCDLFVHSGRRRLGERDTSQNEEDTFQDVSDASSDTSSSSAASPDFSDISDLELDLPLRTAWSNLGGWSSPNVNPSPFCQEGERSTTAGETPVRVSVREVVAEMERGQNSGEAAEGGAVGGQAQDTNLSSDEVMPRNPDRSQDGTTDTGCILTSNGHVHPKSNVEPKCSVFNCSSQAATAVYVRCKHCNRVFCQSCVHHSSSARRCYKRPRGHSFVLIPHSSSQAHSSNNNNSNCDAPPAVVSWGSHRHRRHHHPGYHHHHHHAGSRHHQHHSSSRRHHHHQHSSHHHDNQEYSQHQHLRRDFRRSRSRGQHRSGGHQEFEDGHVRVQREGNHSRAMERFFEDLII
ncbi:uncharacterized protein LOC129261089 [Lytechinus pictus]|uniref:uncharacterized protein LOC129261089 n=1 Tax=Lytechinus pictus TaxID=7653 RepID=UPI0030B9C0BA